MKTETKDSFFITNKKQTKKTQNFLKQTIHQIIAKEKKEIIVHKIINDDKKK